MVGQVSAPYRSAEATRPASRSKSMRLSSGASRTSREGLAQKRKSRKRPRSMLPSHLRPKSRPPRLPEAARIALKRMDPAGQEPGRAIAAESSELLRDGHALRLSRSTELTGDGSGDRWDP